MLFTFELIKRSSTVTAVYLRWGGARAGMIQVAVSGAGCFSWWTRGLISQRNSKMSGEIKYGDNLPAADFFPEALFMDTFISVR